MAHRLARKKLKWFKLDNTEHDMDTKKLIKI